MSGESDAADRNFSKGNETAKPRKGSPSLLGKSEFQRKFIWSVVGCPGVAGIDAKWELDTTFL